MNSDILQRLKNSSKINGAYPRDIADAIAEIERLQRDLEDAREWLLFYEEQSQ